MLQCSQSRSVLGRRRYKCYYPLTAFLPGERRFCNSCRSVCATRTHQSFSTGAGKSGTSRATFSLWWEREQFDLLNSHSASRVKKGLPFSCNLENRFIPQADSNRKGHTCATGHAKHPGLLGISWHPQNTGHPNFHHNRGSR